MSYSIFSRGLKSKATDLWNWKGILILDSRNLEMNISTWQTDNVIYVDKHCCIGQKFIQECELNVYVIQWISNSCAVIQKPWYYNGTK